MSLTPMDVYSSRMDIPFNMAAYCRGHKFSVEAVALRNAIERCFAASKQITQAEQFLTLKERELQTAIEAVKQKMERDPL